MKVKANVLRGLLCWKMMFWKKATAKKDALLHLYMQGQYPGSYSFYTVIIDR